MQYQLVFDAAQSGYRYWWFPAAGFLMFAFFFALFRFPHKLGKARVPTSRFGRLFPLGFCLFWTSLALVLTLGDYIKLRNALRSNRYTIVEGRVTEFVPMPYEGHSEESFVVNGRRYEYSDYEVSAGFNNTQSHGGPIKEGIQVRIADVDGKIARLEIAK